MALSALFALFLKGVLMGVALAAPVGPIGILCIRRTLAGRYPLSLATGLGAGMADTFYGAIAGFSLVSIADFLEQHDFYLRVFGVILIGWLGVSFLKTPLCKIPQKTSTTETLFHAFASSFFLTLSNPLTLIAFTATFAALGIAPDKDSWIQSLVLIAGVFIGANAWWVFLTTTVKLFHHKISDRHLQGINRISGLMLLGFAVYMGLSLIG